ncbi:MAG: prolyl oligopeptidase family serine peptidase [Armatimonadetes bacterium]|nr:prolyl oligopeptidase family serine peptidase [Armatimonadota bacterium]
MRTWRLLALLTVPLAACGQAPREVVCAPCTVAPRLDGAIGPGEWPDAGRLAWTMPMTRTDGAAEARPVVLWAENSRTNLYLAFRVPDAQRQLDLATPIADLVVLAFCRGAALAAGDDRKVLLPGVCVDKHFVAPGKDADDAGKQGRGVMRWHPEEGGYYVIELQVPLDSGDAQDLRAAPGQRVRFNLVYADGFRPGGQGMEAGGLFGGNADDATAWGELVLANEVGVEQPAPVSPAVAALFPYTDVPDHLQHRLRRLETQDLEVDGKLGGVVVVELEYPRVDGQPEKGQARVFLPPELLADPGTPLPLVHAAGYELDDGSAVGLLREGLIVATPHAHPLTTLSRGPNLDLALLHAMRAQPWVDGRRILIQGGSAGGWTTLMMAAETFPLVGAMPAVPPLDWGYNAAYIAGQGAVADVPADPTKSKTPVLAAVRAIVQQLETYFNVPYESDALRALSPIAQLETITAPTQVFFSTADMLVPVDQVSAAHVQPHDAALFPAGFATSPAACLKGRPVRTLAEVLPAERAEWFVPELAPNTAKLRADGSVEPGTPPPLKMPFSTERQWSVVILNEGPVEPQVGHFKYAWGNDTSGFRHWALAKGPQPAQLTADKLRRLMLRLAHRPWLTGSIQPHGAAAPQEICLLDWPEAERADVLTGLRDFAAEDACALRLAELYKALPDELKGLGLSLGDTASAVRGALPRW